jgi:uncharacterized protein YecT (DUF1311 family)
MLGRILLGATVLSLTCQYLFGQEYLTPRKVAPEQIPAYGSDAEKVPPLTIVTATEQLPYGACDGDITPRQRTLCLQQTSEFMNGLASETVREAARAIGEQPRVTQAQRQFAERTLVQAQEIWAKNRDLECGLLARFDVTLPGDIYERRLRCLIRADRERIAALRLKFAKDARP